MGRMGKKVCCFKVIGICCIFLSLMLSSCGGDNIRRGENSIALIKNVSMSTYGTGIAVGIPGEEIDTIVTSYSVIATSNGAVPKTAEVRINETERKLSANVAYYDTGRNIAILKLSKPTKELEAAVFKSSVGYNETIYVKGYDGTGNIMSDFENFNTGDIVQYSGNVSTFDELNTILVYRYSNEFNRAAVGAPALDKNGNIIGMCAYSQDGMNTYSQYILSSDELIRVFTAQNVEFMTSEEVKYKNIMITSIVLGLAIFAAIIIYVVMMGRKKGNKSKSKTTYIKISDGKLQGYVYEFNGKITIGRNPDVCDIVYPIDEPGISAVHCIIQSDGDNCYLTDNNSRYGTFLEDGMRLEAFVPYKIENSEFAFYIAMPQNRIEIIKREDI